ncbi:trans-aconitate 2-methyltransferase [Camelimonas lactis]|uniref:Trans-aconitate 2-methyltransferase n=1 Tax=Camelimonas lactis TaxID=659006 RepID=A0A4V2RXW9_9HYPH|nr:trans-aconitate 2-methyltransferase [Camelimonas lactis]TCO16028.1 trans-aconitate 2-methyltransferase [Camelimonas lactis]
MTAWNPAQYLKFEDERTRAARDLLARVPGHGYGPGGDAAPARVFDLGCGPGNSTELLADRFPEARLEGLDSSPDMLEEARRRLPQVNFAGADLASWTPPQDADLLFANAVFQWVPGHLAAMARILAALSSGAVLAVQMPDNLEQPSHRLMREIAQEAPFASKLAGAIILRRPLEPVGVCYDALSGLCSDLDIWGVTYHHRMASPASITQWVMGTGLRPFLEPLDADERAWFLDTYTQAVSEAYPPQRDGTTLLPFPRRFIIARRA